MTPGRILIAEDERDIATVVALTIRMMWPQCDEQVASDGAAALRDFAEQRPDLAILDVMMPPPDGFEVCRRIREVSNIPILMLTARESVTDKVRALDLGADDYLTKPFDHLELQARLRSLARRARPPQAAQGAQPTSLLRAGEVALDSARHTAYVQGAPVPLTTMESRLLEELMRSSGSVVSHATLLARVWGEGYADSPHYLKVFVRRLRQKLGDIAERPRYIQNVRGYGYRFLDASADTSAGV